MGEFGGGGVGYVEGDCRVRIRIFLVSECSEPRGG